MASKAVHEADVPKTSQDGPTARPRRTPGQYGAAEKPRSGGEAPDNRERDRPRTPPTVPNNAGLHRRAQDATRRGATGMAAGDAACNDTGGHIAPPFTFARLLQPASHLTPTSHVVSRPAAPPASPCTLTGTLSEKATPPLISANGRPAPLSPRSPAPPPESVG